MKNKKKFILKKTALLLSALLLILIGTILLWVSSINLPDISNFETRKVANSSKITDRTGNVILYDIHQSVRRTEIPLSEMSTYIKQAVISVEDRNFYTHNGIRITSIARAFLANIMKSKYSQGGSTITQQIVKNTLLTTDKTLTRKSKEIILALKLEKRFSKDQILEIYLNDAPYGSTIYGIEEASQAFFNKKAKDLTLAEAAYFAVIPEAPTYYSPFGKNKTKLDEKKNIVLKKMLEYGYVDEVKYQEALNEKVVFNIEATNSIKAPHFVFFILDYLQQKYGQDIMETGGLVVKTTLDYELQKKAEELVLENSKINEKKYNASNASLVAIDPKNGHILSMVGSRDYFDKSIDGAYNIATAKRQPGSSFKPFIYASAFKKGYTPETILFDLPTEFSTNCTAFQVPLSGFTEKDCYHPNNFDNKYKGPMTLRSALSESRNVPSVKLMYLVGIDNAIEEAKDLGITTLTNSKDYGLSLVLGGGEVTLLDITSAYSVFANSGLRNPPVGILEIKDRDGNILKKYEDNSSQVLEKNVALTLNDVLSDSVARIPTFGDKISILNVAVKTGTTNDDRDAWIIGYNTDIAVGVWSGNNNNKSMTSGGAAVSGPIWKSFMEDFIKNKQSTPFEKPIPDPDYENLKPIFKGKWLILNSENNINSILFWVDKNNPKGSPPSDPNSDPQFKLWNPPIQNWWLNNQFNYNLTTN